MCKKYIVTGSDKKLEGYGIKYPWRGLIESDYKIVGVDEMSYKSYIAGDVYLIIEYDPLDSVRDNDCSVEVKKGKVVYISKRIRNIQRWLERHGCNYRGYGANIKIEDNETLMVGKKCYVEAGEKLKLFSDDDIHVLAGNNLRGVVGDNSIVVCGHDSVVFAGDYSSIRSGDRSTLVSGYESVLESGCESNLKAGPNSTLSAGENSILVWDFSEGDSTRLIEKIITKEEAMKKYIGQNKYRGEIEIKEVLNERSS